MKGQKNKRITLPRHVSTLVIVAVLALASLAQIGSTVHAQEPDSTPPGNCWGGALSEDPLHCWLLGQAQSDGIIEVDGVYGVGQSLHIYLKQAEPLGEDVYRYLREKAETREFECPRISHTRGCELGVFRYKEWWPSTLYILPISQVYENIRLLPGGADARRSEIGWPSYRQLWPNVARATGGDDDAETYSFDLSEVDTINFEFPPASCWPGHSESCHKWREWQYESARNIRGGYAPIDTAGWYDKPYLNASWIQVPIEPGEGSEKLVAVKKTIRERHWRSDEHELILIPVKYGYKDMWHWAELLNRFARSSGNTIGITEATIWYNVPLTRGETVFLLSSLQEAFESEFGGPDYNTVRDTIHVTTLDLQKTVDALPHLLGQLDIPVDAVGMVYRRDKSPVGPDVPAVIQDQVQPSETKTTGESTSSESESVSTIGSEAGQADQQSTGIVAVVSDGAGSVFQSRS